MSHGSNQRRPAWMHPIGQMLALFMGVIILVGAFFVGAFLLAIFLGVGLILALVVGIRVWWLRRRFRQMAGTGQGPGGFFRVETVDLRTGRRTGPGSDKESTEVIDVEYTIIEPDTDDERRD